MHTPTAYVIVGAFIVQFETAKHIEEALNIFKEWCPSVNPKYWMTDRSLAEINAIAAAFSEGRITICDFHCERAWKRLCNRKENYHDKGKVLALLRKVALALTKKEYEAASNELQSSSYWKANSSSATSVASAATKKCWVRCFRTDLNITTNNGTEAQNRKLKECYLKNCSGRRNLVGLIEVLLHQFLLDC